MSDKLDPGNRYGGAARLYGRAGFARIRAARVLVVGVGGVGSWTVEALARSGVGTLGLCDLDDVCVTNTNRQIHAVDGTVGMAKVEAMRSRVALIDPTMKVEGIQRFFTKSASAEILGAGWDVVVDAIDVMNPKCQLIADCLAADIPVVTCGGAGGKSDPTQIRSDDLASARNDPMLRRVRSLLRREFGFAQRNKDPFGVRAVFCLQNPVYPWANGSVCNKPEMGESLRLDCASGFGTSCAMTGSLGFAAAAEALDVVVCGSDHGDQV